jgi:hypothetical protein
MYEMRRANLDELHEMRHAMRRAPAGMPFQFVAEFNRARALEDIEAAIKRRETRNANRAAKRRN